MTGAACALRHCRLATGSCCRLEGQSVADSNPWETLGIPQGASKAEIRRAYRRLARRYHPDLNPGDPDAGAQFKRVQAAYEALSTPNGRKRAQRQPFPADVDVIYSQFVADDHPFLSFWGAYMRMRQSRKG